MALRVIGKEELAGFISRLIAAEREVIGSVSKGDKYVFAPLTDVKELVLDYVSSLLPPKKQLLPARETIVRFKTAPRLEIEAVIESPPQILVGVHPCDLRGIWGLDQTFGDDHLDAHYAARRAATLLIGVDCLPDEYCFCTSVGSNLPEAGTFDLFLTNIGDAYIVEIGSENGQALLARYAQTREASGGDLAALAKSRQRKAQAVQAHLNADVQTLPLLFESMQKAAVWEETAVKCLSCGACNLVCPTCYCFDVGDLMQLNLSEGERWRQWDGCMLADFATVAGGHNFRKQVKDRLRHRYYRKFQYLMTKYGKSFCTGCGRCSRACLVHINPPDTVNALIAESEEVA